MEKERFRKIVEHEGGVALCGGRHKGFVASLGRWVGEVGTCQKKEQTRMAWIGKLEST